MPAFRIHASVASEFSEVRAWYADRSLQAAQNFVLQFETALIHVENRPAVHAPRRAVFRRARLKRFPYLIIFHLGREFVSVRALVHEHREPRAALGSIRQRLAKLP